MANDNLPAAADNLQFTLHHTFSISFQARNSQSSPQILLPHASTHLDCLLGLYWTGFILPNGFPVILGSAVNFQLSRKPSRLFRSRSQCDS